MDKIAICTKSAPQAIGPYSQAITKDWFTCISGQIPLEPSSMQLVEGGIRPQSVRVFENLKAVAEAAGGSLSDIIQITAYLIDLRDFEEFNAVMKDYFSQPYPARVTVEVSKLPKSSLIEVSAIMGQHPANNADF